MKKRKGYVNPSLAQEIVCRNMGICEIEGCNNVGSNIHHIVGRRVDANEHNLILLCWEHHLGTAGAHGRDGHTLDLKLKLELQNKYFDMGKSEDEVRKLMGGKLYLEETT